MLYDTYYNREYRIEVRQKGEPIFASDKLDVKFVIDRYRFTDKCESSISILGLDRDKITSIAKVARTVFSKAMEMQIEIYLWAGYKGCCPLIYKGYVVSAHVDSPPNMWLHMKCMNYTEYGEEPKSICIYTNKNTKLTNRNIAEMVCRKLGMPPPDMSGYHPIGNDRTKSEVLMSGKFTRAKALSYLYKFNDNWIVYYDMGRVYIADKKPNPSFARKIPLNEKNGLLSVTGVSFTGCKVTTLLQDCDPTISIADVKSKYNVGVNDAKWTVIGKRFEGHFRGNKWQTTFDLLVEDQIV